MKYLKTSIIGFFVAIMLSGCIVSLHPLYTKKDIIFEPDLVGQWTEGEGKGKWEFQKIWNKRYKLVHTDKDGEEGRFLAVLLKVKGHMFLDLRPLAPKEDLRPLSPEEDTLTMNLEELREYMQPLDLEEDLKLNSLYKWHLLPAHTFYHVKQITPALQFRALNPTGFMALLDKNPEEIRYEEVSMNDLGVMDSEIMYALTAQPKELQEFLVKHLNTKVTGKFDNKPEGVFTDFRNMHRISAEDDTETEKNKLNTDSNTSGNSQSDSAVPE
ncbi:MAG: hypothetical protein D3925_14400 [Candidatus Electrothrix sp. AR5]|nr:hypothetical protein [Candidatus Electrothrix sp. AR5]